MDRPARPVLSSVPVPSASPARSRYLEGMFRQTRLLVAGSRQCLEESRALLDALPQPRLRTPPDR